MRALSGPRDVTSVFFGGGTPSLMAPQTVEAILSAIDKAWHLRDDSEFTLEANPTSVEADRFSAYRTAGVNRVWEQLHADDDPIELPAYAGQLVHQRWHPQPVNPEGRS